MDTAGSVAGLTETALIPYINTELNGTNTGSRAPYALSSHASTDVSSLQDQVKNGNLDILLVIARAPNGDLRYTYFTNASSSSDTNLPNIQALTQLLTFLDTAHRLGLTTAQAQRLGASPDLAVVYTQQSQTTQSTGEIAAGFVIAYAGAILIYVLVGLYGSSVAAGVAEEKSSRMMEILVNAATPFQLLAGTRSLIQMRL